MLTYKAESAGGEVLRVDPKNTSQICFGCGSMPTRKLTLSDRRYQCEFCGYEADRDINAARNILQRGLEMSLKPGGNFPARGENESDEVALAVSTA